MAELSASWEIRVERTGELLAADARMARSVVERMVGLLGRRVLRDGEALILLACRAIHTCFMRFAIDVVFVNGAWGVVAIRCTLPPWRLTPVVWAAEAAIELPAGQVTRAQHAVGDRLVLQPVSGRNPLDRG